MLSATIEHLIFEMCGSYQHAAVKQRDFKLLFVCLGCFLYACRCQWVTIKHKLLFALLLQDKSQRTIKCW